VKFHSRRELLERPITFLSRLETFASTSPEEHLARVRRNLDERVTAEIQNRREALTQQLSPFRRAASVWKHPLDTKIPNLGNLTAHEIQILARITKTEISKGTKAGGFVAIVLAFLAVRCSRDSGSPTAPPSVPSPTPTPPVSRTQPISFANASLIQSGYASGEQLLTALSRAGFSWRPRTTTPGQGTLEFFPPGTSPGPDSAFGWLVAVENDLRLTLNNKTMGNQDLWAVYRKTAKG
jgi:hypothetical protein